MFSKEAELTERGWVWGFLKYRNTLKKTVIVICSTPRKSNPRTHTPKRKDSSESKPRLHLPSIHPVPSVVKNGTLRAPHPG